MEEYQIKDYLRLKTKQTNKQKTPKEIILIFLLLFSKEETGSEIMS